MKFYLPCLTKWEFVDMKIYKKNAPRVILCMFISISDSHIYASWQTRNNNWFVYLKSASRGRQSNTYFGPHVLNFIIPTINPICSRGPCNICQLLPCKFDVVITDIKTVKHSADLDLHVLICKYKYRCGCFRVYLCLYLSALSFFSSSSISETNLKPCIA